MRKTGIASLVISLGLAMGATVPAYSSVPEAELADKKIYGHIEQVQLGDLPEPIPARLDTGAQRSSLHAEDIELIEEDGERLVRFVFRNGDGEAHTITRPLVEETRVRQASGEESRYVVSLPLCVGDQRSDTEFTLSDRSTMTYPMLVGRNFLSSHALVSSAHRNTLTPAC